MTRGPIIAVVVGAAAVAFILGVSARVLLTALFVLACPLMMLFMHHGGHGSHVTHGAGHSASDEPPRKDG